MTYLVVSIYFHDPFLLGQSSGRGQYKRLWHMTSTSVFSPPSSPWLRERGQNKGLWRMTTTCVFSPPASPWLRERGHNERLWRMTSVARFSQSLSPLVGRAGSGPVPVATEFTEGLTFCLLACVHPTTAVMSTEQVVATSSTVVFCGTAVPTLDDRTIQRWVIFCALRALACAKTLHRHQCCFC